MQFTIRHYPIVIETSEEVLDVVLGTDSSPPDWTQLRRIATQDVQQLLSGLVDNITHFFSQTGDLATTRFMLGYTGDGRLSKIVQRQHDKWDVIEVPADVSDKCVTQPSVRLVFKTERARAVFMHYLQQIVETPKNNPTLASVLEQLYEPPLQSDVWRNP